MARERNSGMDRTRNHIKYLSKTCLKMHDKPTIRIKALKKFHFLHIEIYKPHPDQKTSTFNNQATQKLIATNSLTNSNYHVSKVTVHACCDEQSK